MAAKLGELVPPLTSTQQTQSGPNFDHHVLPDEDTERHLRRLLPLYYIAALIDALTFVVFLTLKEPKVKV